MLAKLARISLQMLEALTVLVLTVEALLALLGVVVEIPSLLRPPFLDAERLTSLLDHLLGVFVLIELLVIAVAYLRGSEIVRRIFEASLVALARKLISIETLSLAKTGSLALLFTAVGLTWFLISKGEAARQ